MAAISLLRIRLHLTNSILSGMVCFGERLIVFTPLPAALCIGRPRYHPFPLPANTPVSQLPSPRSAPPQNSILPPPGYPSLSPPGTRVIQRRITAFSSRAPPKPSTLLHGAVQRLTPPITCLLTLYATGFPTSLRKSQSFRSPLLTSCPYL